MNKKMKKLLLGGLAIGGVAAVYAATKKKDTAAIVLKENLTEGFLWQYTVEKEGIVREYRSDYLPMFGGSDGEAESGQHKWVFAPVKAGETVLRFSYVRPWESDEPAAVTAAYRVVVDSQRKITITLLEHSPNFEEYALSAR